MSYRLGLAVSLCPDTNYLAPQKQGTYARGLVKVGDGGLGGTGFGSDVQAEISQLDGEMRSLNSELFAGLPASTEDPKFQFYSAVWRPFAEQWQDFRDGRQGVSLANLVRSMSLVTQRGVWKDLQDYRGRLGEMYAKAREVGFQLVGPEPTAPKTSVFQDVGNLGSGLVDFIKTLVYIAIGLGVGWLLIQFLREVRS
jgi:hypothetical protein